MDTEDPTVKRMFAMLDMIENLYKKMEINMPCEPMTDEMLAKMNTSLGFIGEHAKTREYRPYCVKEGCEYMPRMMRIKEGFACWSCKNKWDLTK